MQADDLLELIATTRAIRRYDEAPIPSDDLAKIMFAATRAPSGSNRQSTRYVVLRDGPRAVKAKALLGESARQGWGDKYTADQYEAGSGADVDSPKARFARSMQHYVDNFEQVPVVVLLCFRPRHHSVADGGGVFPAAQNLLLAARALGYGGVLTGWHKSVEGELTDLLGIPDEFDIAITITLGRPLGQHGPVRRLPMGQVVFDDHWDSTAQWAIDPPGTRFTQAGPPSS